MWNDNDIFANDIADKFEQKMFCNFGGGSSPSSSGGESRGVTISGGTLSGGTTAGSGGGDTGGYDVLGTGAVGDPTRGGQVTLADISGGDSSDDAYVAAIQANVDRQLTQQAIQRLQQAGLPQQIQQGFAAGTSPYAQLSARQNLMQFPNIGLLGTGLNMLGQRTAKGIMERIQAGGTPVYDRTGQIVGVNSPSAVGDKIGGYIEDKFGIDVPRSYSYFGRPEYDPQQGQSKPIMDDMGNIIGYEGDGFPDVSDDGGYVAPEAAVVVAAQPEEEKSMIPMDYRYPAGGVYPEEGLYRRMGLLDIAPTQYGGLLAGYDQPQFEAMQAGFQRPVDVGLFEDPYDVKGYTLLS